MPKSIVIFLILVCSTLYGQEQINNRLINFRLGYTIQQIQHQALIKEINDTSSLKYDMVMQMPSISYSHEFVLSRIISIGGTAGFEYMNVFRGNEHFGSSFFFLSVDPRISIFSRSRFEYYMKLRIGGTFWTHDISKLDDFGRRLFPGRANFFTGVTVGGFNFFLNKNWGVNIELSLWSPELVALGLTYRFWRGKLPKVQGTENAAEAK